MSTADELIAALSETVPIHTHPVSDSDTYFVIDPITRLVTNTAENKNVLVQYDHDSERFTFELPRYVEGHDMMLCNAVKVHFNNIDSETEEEGIGVYDVTDLRIDPANSSNVICTWLISRNATQFIGTLSFIVQYACVDGDGNVVYEWHSDIYYDIQIIQGRNYGEQVITEHTDILEQWRASLFGAGDSAVADIEETFETKKAELLAESQTQQDNIVAKGEEVLETIPEDYTETHNKAEEALRKKADAIYMSASGESPICLDDSSDSNFVGLNIYGKTTQATTNGYQLFDASKINSRTMGKAIVTNNGDGSFTITNNSAGDAIDFLYYYDYSHEETLALISKAGTYHLTTEKATSPYVYVAFSIGGSFQYELQCRSGSSSSLQITDTMRNDSTFYMRIGFYGFSSTATTPAIIRPMLYIDGDGTWESFSGARPGPNPEYPMALDSVENPVIRVYSKNLLRNQYADVFTSNGVTFTKLPDGGIHIKGTPTASIYYNIDFLTNRTPILHKGERVVISLEMTNHVPDLRLLPGYFTAYGTHVNSAYNMQVGVGTTGIYNPQMTITYPEEAVEYRTFIGLPPASSNEIDTIVYPKIQLAEFSDVTFEAFNEQTLSLNRELHGIPISQNGNYTDSNGQQWICDEIDFERGKYIQRIREHVIDGNHGVDTDGAEGNPWRKYIWINANPRMKGTGYYCDKLPVKTSVELIRGNAPEDAGIHMSDTYNVVYFNIGYLMGEDTVEAAQTALRANPLTIRYALATPIETDLSATELQAFKALVTHKTNTTIFNDQNARMSVKYIADLERYIYDNVQSKARLFDITLPAANWLESSDGSYYYQVVDESVRESSKIDLSPTVEQLISILTDGYTMFAGNNNGVLTVYSIGATPGHDMTINAIETVVVYE